jgi:hypothetical protein
MVPLPSLAEIPQLQALQSQVRRLWAAQTVVVLASDRGLWIAWPLLGRHLVVGHERDRHLLIGTLGNFVFEVAA